jgi:hypothetical protein
VNLFSILWGGHCFGSSRTRHIMGRKITVFKLGHPGFDGGIWWCMFPQCFFQNGVNFLRRLALQKKKILVTAHISVFFKWLATPGMHSFSLCYKKRLEIWHMNRPIFPMTLSIPSYEIGKWVGLRTYQHSILLSHHVISNVLLNGFMIMSLRKRKMSRVCTVTSTFFFILNNQSMESIYLINFQLYCLKVLFCWNILNSTILKLFNKMTDKHNKEFYETEFL